MNTILFSILAILTIFQLTFVGGILFLSRKAKVISNWFLGSVFILFALSLSDFVLRINGIVFRQAALHLVDDGFFLLYGPLLFLYVKSIAYRNFKLTKHYMLHFIPYVLFLGLVILIAASAGDSNGEDLFEMIYDGNPLPWVYFLNIGMYISLFVYVFSTFRLIKQYGKVLKESYSSNLQVKLGWLKFIIRYFLGITLISLVHNFVQAFDHAWAMHLSLLMLLLLTFFFINKVIFKAMNQSLPLDEMENRRYLSSSNKILSEEKSRDILSAVGSILEKEKLFIDPELKLKDLADHLQVQSRILSQVINNSTGKNFYDFINTYRCEEVKSYIRENEKITFLEAMYQSGFNSKSSFNKEFKKLTGLTPSEYRQSLKK